MAEFLPRDLDPVYSPLSRLSVSEFTDSLEEDLDRPVFVGGFRPVAGDFRPELKARRSW